VVDQEYLCCESKLFSGRCKLLVRYYETVISLLVTFACYRLLNSFIPHRLRIKLALKHNTRTIFLRYNVNALVATLLGYMSIPTGSAQLFGAKRAIASNSASPPPAAGSYRTNERPRNSDRSVLAVRFASRWAQACAAHVFDLNQQSSKIAA
jgi:hypothetical protein